MMSVDFLQPDTAGVIGMFSPGVVSTFSIGVVKIGALS